MTPQHHVSTGEPAGRWKLWAKWLRLAAAWAAGMRISNLGRGFDMAVLRNTFCC